VPELLSAARRALEAEPLHSWSGAEEEGAARGAALLGAIQLGRPGGRVMSAAAPDGVSFLFHAAERVTGGVLFDCPSSCPTAASPAADPAPWHLFASQGRPLSAVATSWLFSPGPRLAGTCLDSLRVLCYLLVTRLAGRYYAAGSSAAAAASRLRRRQCSAGAKRPSHQSGRLQPDAGATGNAAYWCAPGPRILQLF
jgi:hypothetical protein